MIRTDEDLARLFGIDVGTKAELVATEDGDAERQKVTLEELISNRVYKHTNCGAWAKLETALPVGAKSTEEWLVHIRKVVDGIGDVRYRCHKAHMVSPEVRDWVRVDKWSSDLVLAVAFEAGLDDGYILDEVLVEFLGDLEWDERGECGDYFNVVFNTYAGGYAPGVTFGSIVEGAEECAEMVSVAFPCDPQDIWNALDAVEKDADRIWSETHGCPFCWGAGDFEDNTWTENHSVDPDCAECHGKGIVI